MRFKLDENLPPEAAAFLRDRGHEVPTVWDQGLRGRPDAEVAKLALVSPAPSSRWTRALRTFAATRLSSPTDQLCPPLGSKTKGRLGASFFRLWARTFCP